MTRDNRRRILLTSCPSFSWRSPQPCRRPGVLGRERRIPALFGGIAALQGVVPPERQLGALYDPAREARRAHVRGQRFSWTIPASRISGSRLCREPRAQLTIRRGGADDSDGGRSLGRSVGNAGGSCRLDDATPGGSTKLFDNIVRFNLARPADFTSWLFYAPPAVGSLARIGSGRPPP